MCGSSPRAPQASVLIPLLGGVGLQWGNPTPPPHLPSPSVPCPLPSPAHRNLPRPVHAAPPASVGQCWPDAPDGRAIAQGALGLACDGWQQHCSPPASAEATSTEPRVLLLQTSRLRTGCSSCSERGCTPPPKSRSAWPGDLPGDSPPARRLPRNTQGREKRREGSGPGSYVGRSTLLIANPQPQQPTDRQRALRSLQRPLGSTPGRHPWRGGWSR